MKDIVFVSGHKNPDSDSICSAIAYADYFIDNNGTILEFHQRLDDLLEKIN